MPNKILRISVVFLNKESSCFSIKKIHFYKGFCVDFHWNIDFNACRTMQWMCAVKIQDSTDEIQDVTHLCYK